MELLKNASTLGEECFRNVSDYLYAAVTCGGRQGRLGEPFPADLALKERCDELVRSLPIGAPERGFFESLVKHANMEIDRSKKEGELLDG